MSNKVLNIDRIYKIEDITINRKNDRNCIKLQVGRQNKRDGQKDRQNDGLINRMKDRDLKIG